MYSQQRNCTPSVPMFTFMCPVKVGIGTIAVQFLSWEYLYRIFGIVSLQCTVRSCGIKKTATNWLLIIQTTLSSLPQRLRWLSKNYNCQHSIKGPVEKFCQKDLATFPLMPAVAAVVETDHEFHLQISLPNDFLLM
jgi:hypothetical protein